MYKASRSQSAMEYLMTYGWAILVIAIVIAALFSLNIFSPFEFSPKASPGSCYVSKPDIYGSPIPSSLVGGGCSEIPEYTAQFNGQSSSIVTGTKLLPLGDEARSAFMWIYVENLTSDYIIEGYGNYSTTLGNQYVALWLYGGYIYFGDNQENFYSYSIPKTDLGKWYFVGYSYSGGASNTITVYLDTVNDTASMQKALNTTLPASQAAFIGAGLGGYGYGFYKGDISNVQVYNSSLSNNDVNALYQEGIGGAPIDLQNLVGWWPLDGNANDYSGNGNNGAATNVKYVSNWESGYSAP